MRLALIATALVGCGRLDFDVLRDAGGDGIGSPRIISVTPRWSDPGGGPISVEVSGSPNAITIDGASCTTSSTTATTIECTAPAHAPASVAIAADGNVFALPFVYVAPGFHQIGSPLDDNSSGVAVDPDGNVYLTGGTMGSLDGANPGDFDAVLVKYDASGTLAWVRQLGTPLYDYARDVSVDASGNAEIVGYTTGDLGGTGNAGSNDVFVARYAPDGTRLWVTQTGSAGDDQAFDLGIDASGETVVAGQTTGALDGPNAGLNDAVLLRYANDGHLLWTRQTGGAPDDFGHSVVAAPDGTAYFVGYTRGVMDGTANAGGLDAFVARYASDGTRLWIHQRGSTSDDAANDVALDPQGDVWVVGATSGALDGNANLGGQDVFAMHYAADGTWLFTRQYGGAGLESSFGVTASSMQVYLECNTTMAFDGQTYAGGANDFCVVSLDRAGNHLWTRLGGGALVDQASSCALDPNLTGFVYVSLITTGALDGTNFGGNDFALAKLDATGALR